jgi:putative NIF3 family GTP cyclohydrolase 1 type 2
MLLDEEPRLVIAFHEDFDPAAGGTSDTCLRALLLDIPVWLTPTHDPGVGWWLSSDQFPQLRTDQLQRQLHRAVHDRPRSGRDTGTVG